MPALGPLFVIGLPILTVLMAAMVGRTRRSGFWLTLIVSALLTPIVGFALAIVSGPKPWPGHRRNARDKYGRRGGPWRG